MRTAVVNQSYASGISTSGKSPGIACLTLARGFSTFSFIDMHVHKPSLHVSGKPRKELGFPCFPTVPKFPIPPICPRPPQRFLSGATSDILQTISSEKKSCKEYLSYNGFACQGKKFSHQGVWGKKFLRKPNPPPPPPRP